MDERKIRELLARYKPAGTPAGLRERALARPVDTARTWPWVAAAAALLAIAVGFRVAASGIALEEPDVATTTETVEFIAAALGGDPDARRRAELIVADQQWRALGDPDPAPERSDSP